MLQSMTGFARAGGRDETGSWVFELKSVNGKSLDIRLRLPGGLEALEQEIRQKIQQRFSRGSVQCGLTLEAANQETIPVVNRNLLDEIIAVCGDISKKHPEIGQLTMDGLMSVRGMIEMEECAPDEQALVARNAHILESLDVALDQLAAARSQEGEKIGLVLSSQLDEIEVLTKQVESDPSRSSEAIREKLHARISELMEDIGSLDSNRVYQEAATMAVKADLAEEIDRLYSHLSQARQLLGSCEPVGRKLDFLCQEFNRECNTICSKSNAASITRHGLEMKVLVDRFREQIQNIE